VPELNAALRDLENLIHSETLQVPNVNKKYRTALTITGIVTFIATYHYFRIFNLWSDTLDVRFDTHLAALLCPL
jgi:hypothetical protein